MINSKLYHSIKAKKTIEKQLKSNTYNPKKEKKAGNLSDLIINMVELKGFEPLTPCVQGRCSPS